MHEPDFFSDQASEKSGGWSNPPSSTTKLSKGCDSWSARRAFVVKFLKQIRRRVRQATTSLHPAHCFVEAQSKRPWRRSRWRRDLPGSNDRHRHRQPIGSSETRRALPRQKPGGPMDSLFGSNLWSKSQTTARSTRIKTNWLDRMWPRFWVHPRDARCQQAWPTTPPNPDCEHPRAWFWPSTIDHAGKSRWAHPKLTQGTCPRPCCPKPRKWSTRPDWRWHMVAKYSDAVLQKMNPADSTWAKS